MSSEILLVAATPGELAAIRTPPGTRTLITGIGLANAAVSLTMSLLSGTPRMVVHAGIAGSFRDDLPPGALCEIISDCFGDFGAWAPAGYTGNDAGSARRALAENDAIIPFDPTIYRNPHRFTTLPGVHAVSVQTVSGTETSIRQIRSQFNPDIETMEGVVILRLCLQAGIPICGIRAISNPITPRNRERWNVPMAVEELGKFLTTLLPQL